MAKKKKAPEAEEHVNHERWMISYADMLTLLLALFIVMFAISKVDAAKFEIFAEGAAEAFGQANVALQGKVGSLDGSDGILKDQAPNKNSSDPNDIGVLGQQALQKQREQERAFNAEMQKLAKIRDQIERNLKRRGLKDAVVIQVDERGLVVNIVTDKVLFDSGEATLRKDGKAVLGIIAPAVKDLPNRMVVEGHTDNVPMTGKFRSNWELSTARASEVLQELLVNGVNRWRVNSAGYADTKPLGSNATDAGRQRNRRVAIVVLPLITQVSTTSADGTSGTNVGLDTTSSTGQAPHSGANT